MLPSLPVTICATAGEPDGSTDDVTTERAAVFGGLVIQCEGSTVTWVVVALSEVEVPVVERERVVVAIVDASNRIESYV